MSVKPQIIYVTDPMCSWCWAFSPEIDALREHYAAQVDFRLIAGGLRNSATPLSRDDAANLGAYWQTVMDKTGQKFNTEFSPASGFTYNTEPGCRALVTLRSIAPTRVFDYLAALHSAFYVDHEDITSNGVLAEIAQNYGTGKADFTEQLQSGEMRDKTQADFARRLELGVDGFPTLLYNHGDRTQILAHGYQNAQALMPVIEALLVPEVP